MLKLTRQEQTILCVITLLLLTGWAARAWRTSHPSPAATQTPR